MDRETAIEKLKQCQDYDDTERAHNDADDVLRDLLVALGYKDVVEEWVKVEKWYA